MLTYVLGFAFTTDRRRVALLKKERPHWQKGLWNGIGGKVHAGENPPEAMAREFLEETGVSLSKERWSHYATISGPKFTLWVFSVCAQEAFNVRTNTDEKVRLFSLEEVASDLLKAPHVQWLIPLALDKGIVIPLEIKV